jgi:PEP-CTERM motif
MYKAMLKLISLVELLTPLVAAGQGTLYVSNLGEAPDGSVSVGSDSWYAEMFGTGANSGGYSLNSIQLLMAPSSGNPNGFTVSLYSYDSFFPGIELGSLTGSDPAAGGLFTYGASSITLLPSTSYFVVVTATTPAASGAYSWSLASTFNDYSSGGWFLDSAALWHSDDGATWTAARGLPVQVAVYATPVPEPSTLPLAGLGLAAIGFWRFRQSE